jgi:hypothetical protein
MRLRLTLRGRSVTASLDGSTVDDLEHWFAAQ